MQAFHTHCLGQSGKHTKEVRYKITGLPASDINVFASNLSATSNVTAGVRFCPVIAFLRQFIFSQIK